MSLELRYRSIYGSYNERICELREGGVAMSRRQHGASMEYANSGRGAKSPDSVVWVCGETASAEIRGRENVRTRFRGFDHDRRLVAHNGAADRGRPPTLEPGRFVPLHRPGFTAIEERT